MNRCFGPSGRAAISFFQFSFAFGGTCVLTITCTTFSLVTGMCAFGIIIGKYVAFEPPSQAYTLAGDTIPHVIRSVFPDLPSVPVLSLFADRGFVIVLCTVGVSYPLSLYRDIHKLSIASSFALCGMLIIVFSVIYEGPLVSPLLKGDPSKRFSFIEPGIFQAIGVISFAFVCHHNSLLIYGSLKTPTLDRFATVTHVSTALSFVACTTMAVSGYVVFTDRTQGNILNNFSAVSVSRLSRIAGSKFASLERHPDQHRPDLLWPEHVHDASAGAFRVSRSGRAIFLLSRSFQHAAPRLLHHRHPLFVHAQCASMLLTAAHN
jgi:sodium-coupled neutral amino acid transporter 11